MINNIIWAVILITFVTFLSPPTVLVLFVGFLPTGVAYICDKSDEKFAALCVGGLNLCGVFPYILSIWFDAHNIDNAIDIITNFFSLMVMYTAAGLGWGVYRYVPPIISQVVDFLAKRRLTNLHLLQDNLTEEWGALNDSPTNRRNENDDIHQENDKDDATQKT